MKKEGYLVAILAFVIVLVWVAPLFATSAVFVNDSGHPARAIRITFSEPVEITGFGDGFDYQSPEAKAKTFVFTGAPLNELWTFWVSWSPDSATVVKKEWLRTGGGVQLDINIGSTSSTLDPSRVDPGNSASLWVIEQLFLGLVDYDENGKIVPELATSWESSPDATVWTFTLRDDVTWSDGVPVTAADVKCEFLRALDPEHHYRYPYVFDAIHGAKAYYTSEVSNSDEVGVKVLDEHRIQFILDQPASYFPALAVIWPFFAVPKHLVDAMGDAWAEPENIVTDGAYRLVDRKHGDHTALEKNEDYYAAENISIDRVVMWRFDSEEAWDKYVSGLLDTANLTMEQFEQTGDDPTMAGHVRVIPCYQTGFGTGTYLYGFNVKLPPFDNPLVRNAFIAAVDRNGLMRAAASAGVITFPELALTLVPPGISGHANGEEAGIGIPYNPPQAREWLAEAGYPDRSSLPPITLWFNDNPGHRAIAEYIRQNWIDNLGVTAELEGIRWRDYVTKLNVGECQVWRLGWMPDYPDPYSSLHDLINYPAVDIRNGLGGWRDASYDDLVRQLSGEQDAAMRNTLCAQVERIFVETDAVIMPLFYYGAAIATKPYLQRTYPSFGAPDIAKWRLLPESGSN